MFAIKNITKDYSNVRIKTGRSYLNRKIHGIISYANDLESKKKRKIIKYDSIRSSRANSYGRNNLS